MTNEEINKFIQKKHPVDSMVRINFKARKPIKGMFIQTKDFDELSKKNIWRIVSERYFDSYQQSKDLGLTRLFNGTEFTRLEIL